MYDEAQKPTYDSLLAKIRVLNETVWEGRVTEKVVDSWIANFARSEHLDAQKRFSLLYLASKLIYFGDREIRELLRAMYRDLFSHPIKRRIRTELTGPLDFSLISHRYREALAKTRFLGMGNPSESGTHLLYYFRQENQLPKTLFESTHRIFLRDLSTGTQRLRYPAIERYVFLDDFCASGTQAIDYSQEVVAEVKRLNPSVQVCYFSLFAIGDGLDKVKRSTNFDEVGAVAVLDSSFRAFSSDSRFFRVCPDMVDRDWLEEICHRNGELILPGDPLGYKNGQMLIAFHHNVPDNTLPVLWGDDGSGCVWKPLLRRYPKIY